MIRGIVTITIHKRMHRTDVLGYLHSPFHENPEMLFNTAAESVGLERKSIVNRYRNYPDEVAPIIADALEKYLLSFNNDYLSFKIIREEKDTRRQEIIDFNRSLGFEVDFDEEGNLISR